MMGYLGLSISMDEADKKTVQINLFLKDKIGDKTVLTFRRAGVSELEAVLLEEELQRQLADMMEHVRRCAYLKGWRDKSSKCRKRYWWSANATVGKWEEEEAGL
jgi:hypothetical protein